MKFVFENGSRISLLPAIFVSETWYSWTITIGWLKWCCHFQFDKNLED